MLYHRVISLPSDPYLLCVTPQHFAEHLEVLRKYAHPVSLQGLLRAIYDGKLPRRAVVLTFDDGYADNLYNAKPLLERFEIPATVFVTAGQVDSRREFWWDELDRLLLQPGTLPETLQLNLSGSVFKWELGEAATYVEEDYRRWRSWHVEREDNPGPRQRLFRALYARLNPLPAGERQQIMDALLAWAGAEPTARLTHRTLTLDEATLLGQGGFVEIGAHTMTHAALAALVEEDQRNEIEESKERLEAILKRPVTSFAFPYGSCLPETVTILREAGFACACTSHSEPVWRGANHFQLPRVVVRDGDREAFARWLRWWIDG